MGNGEGSRNRICTNQTVQRPHEIDSSMYRSMYDIEVNDSGNMDVLTGILVDVSDSMRQNVGKTEVGQKSESWAKSIFRFIDRLIIHDASSSHQVFAIGVGSSCPQITFDILTTLKALERRGNLSKRGMLEEGMAILETNGAPRVRTWATTDEIDAHIDERQTSVIFYALKNKPVFRDRFIRECLPASCRKIQHSVSSYGLEAVNWTTGTFSPELHRIMNKSSVRDVVQKGIELIRYYILAEVSRNAVHCAKDASKIIHGVADESELTEQRTNELLERVEPYIYGCTPLLRSLHEAVRLFRNNGNHQCKLLFVLSDGIPTDRCTIRPPITELIDLGVTVICCYITRSHIPEPRRLYSQERPEWEEGAKFMFDLSSSIPTHKIPRTLFVKKGYKIDIENNETRMFFQINHPDIINEVCELAKNCVCSQDALADVLSSVSLDIYIDKANEGLSPDRQHGKTCYAIAIATVMHLGMKRIVGREGGCPEFTEIRDELISKYGRQRANVGEVLKEVCPKYRLHYKKADKRGALEAIVEKRPVVAIFQLWDVEWKAFRKFYGKNPRGILTKDDISSYQQRNERSGHAVVLTNFNMTSLRFMNSWGSDWADGGFFRVQNADVLGLQFYDIYWNEEDLLPSEKLAYRRDGADISAKLMRSLTSLQTATYTCPLCNKESSVSAFGGHLLAAQCPACGGTFNANKADSDLALNIYLTSLIASGTA